MRGSRPRLVRRRDRRGRGVRGPLYPRTLPTVLSSSERFDRRVLDALEPIERQWHAELDRLDIAVDEVPEVTDIDPATVVWDSEVVEDAKVPLARLVPPGVDRYGLPTRARVVLYRRPLQARASTGPELTELLREVLVEQIALHLGIDPDSVEGGSDDGPTAD